jgi:hypothetical protein
VRDDFTIEPLSVRVARQEFIDQDYRVLQASKGAPKQSGELKKTIPEGIEFSNAGLGRNFLTEQCLRQFWMSVF